jgi:hypothetical protein
MKKNYIFTLLITLCLTGASFGQGSESFANSNATSSYDDNSFVGDGGVTWSYVQSRNANNDANASGISMPALMLRRVSDDCKITSSTISGGIGEFTMKLYKGFTGGGDRQVELFINGESKGTSTAFNNFDEQVFTVSGIDVSGDIVIEVKNITAKQVIIDDLTWTAFEGDTASLKNNAIEGFATYPNPITNHTFTLTSASSEEKSVTVFNLLGKKVLETRFSGTKSDINVSAINAGIYILKVTESGKTATKKLVIR